jgi:hypothetical protein
VEEWKGVESNYNTPASRRAFCRIVSFTAAKTRRMLPVSVACVKLTINKCSKGRGHTADRPSYLIVASFERIGIGYISPPFQDQVRLKKVNFIQNW